MVRVLTPWKLEMLQGKDFVSFREPPLPLPHPPPLPPVAPSLLEKRWRQSPSWAEAHTPCHHRLFAILERKHI